jgi:hypothetical protein
MSQIDSRAIVRSAVTRTTPFSSRVPQRSLQVERKATAAVLRADPPRLTGLGRTPAGGVLTVRSTDRLPPSDVRIAVDLRNSANHSDLSSAVQCIRAPDAEVSVAVTSARAGPAPDRRLLTVLYAGLPDDWDRSTLAPGDPPPACSLRTSDHVRPLERINE